MCGGRPHQFDKGAKPPLYPHVLSGEAERLCLFSPQKKNST